MVIETSRLILREFNACDAQDLFALNNDPKVIQYTGDPPYESIEAAKDFVRTYSHYREYGFGRWACCLKEMNVFIGWCGLKYSPHLGEYDIGFRFSKEHWGQGFATEAAQACIKYGFEDLQIPRIVGRAMKQNTASIRVLEKLGMRFVEERNCGGEEGVLYELMAD